MQKQQVKLQHVRMRRRDSMGVLVPRVDACSIHVVRQLLTSLRQRRQREQALSIEFGGSTAATDCNLWHPFILFKLPCAAYMLHIHACMPTHGNASDLELRSQHSWQGSHSWYCCQPSCTVCGAQHQRRCMRKRQISVSRRSLEFYRPVKLIDLCQHGHN